jgi:transcriptional regulator with XRE-family HTH domain
MGKKRKKLLTDQLRQAIDDSGLTRYQIAKATGIDESALAKFYNGRRGLSMDALNALGDFLQLTILLGRKRGKKGSSYGEHCKRSGWPAANPVRGS